MKSKYNDIQNGIGKPKIIDDLYNAAREHLNCSGFSTPVADEMRDAALRIEKVWKEETLRDYVEGLEYQRSSLEFERNLARRFYCELKAETDKSKTKEEWAAWNAWEDVFEEEEKGKIRKATPPKFELTEEETQ